MTRPDNLSGCPPDSPPGRTKGRRTDKAVLRAVRCPVESGVSLVTAKGLSGLGMGPCYGVASGAVAQVANPRSERAYVRRNGGSGAATTEAAA